MGVPLNARQPADRVAQIRTVPKLIVYVMSDSLIQLKQQRVASFQGERGANRLT